MFAVLWFLDFTNIHPRYLHSHERVYCLIFFRSKMIDSVKKVQEFVFLSEKLSKEQKELLKVAYEGVCKTHNLNSKLDISCSGCVNNALVIIRNYINEQDSKKVVLPIDVFVDGEHKETITVEVEIDETKRADSTTKEVIDGIGSVADLHDLPRIGKFTKEQLQEMTEEQIKLIAKEKDIKIGRSGKEILITKILKNVNN